jgi:hypothetical protein
MSRPHRPTKFLRSSVLASEEAVSWLTAKLVFGKKFWLRGGFLGGSKHPKIWMVTGIQLVCNAEIKSGWNTSFNANIAATLPIPEPVIGTAVAALPRGGSVGIDVKHGQGSEANNEYLHRDERVWAAQFRELKVKYHGPRDGDDLLVPGVIKLKDLEDIPSGTRSGEPFPGDIAEVEDIAEELGCSLTETGGVAQQMPEDELELFARIANIARVCP